VPAIGKELNVDAVIEGSVLRSADKVRITVQLIRTATDEHLWAGTYDRDLQDILALQSDVTLGIARNVKAAVNGAQSFPVVPRTVAPEVYEAYLKGRFALQRNNRAGLEEALRCFRTAIIADGTFAPAYAGVAAAQSGLGLVFFGMPPGDKAKGYRRGQESAGIGSPACRDSCPACQRPPERLALGGSGDGI
jgi:hypothetical protein